MHRRPVVLRRWCLPLVALSFACAPSPAPAPPDPGDTNARAALVRQYDPAYPRVLATVEALEPDGDDDAGRTDLTAQLERALGDVGNLTLTTAARRDHPRGHAGLAGPYAIGGRSRVTSGATIVVTLELYIRSLRDRMIVGTVMVRGVATATDAPDAAARLARARRAAFALVPVAIWDRFQQIL